MSPHVPALLKTGAGSLCTVPPRCDRMYCMYCTVLYTVHLEERHLRQRGDGTVQISYRQATCSRSRLTAVVVEESVMLCCFAPCCFVYVANSAFPPSLSSLCPFGHHQLVNRASTYSPDGVPRGRLPNRAKHFAEAFSACGSCQRTNGRRRQRVSIAIHSVSLASVHRAAMQHPLSKHCSLIQHKQTKHKY